MITSSQIYIDADHQRNLIAAGWDRDAAEIEWDEIDALRIQQ